MPEPVLIRTKTINVSTGGLYFETLSDQVRPGQRMEMELTVPPGDGYFPYQGRVLADAQIIRVVELPPHPAGEGITHLPRRGVGVNFKTGLKLSF